MPFPASIVGLKLRPHEVAVSARDILAYAAALGAAEAEFMDDARPGGLFALPFQCVSAEWPVAVSVWESLASKMPLAEGRRGVHAMQDSVFHKPVRAGDRLIIEGEIVSARRIRTGVLTVSRLSTHFVPTGEPVTTSWTTTVYRDVELEGDGRSMLDPPALPPGRPSLADDAQTQAIPIDRELPHIYSECARIWNPIHTERREALAAGLPDIILHGTATWALSGLAILRHYGNADVSRLKRLSGRFTGMVIPGGPVTLRHRRLDGGGVAFDVLNADGVEAIGDGFADMGS